MSRSDDGRMVDAIEADGVASCRWTIRPGRADLESDLSLPIDPYSIPLRNLEDCGGFEIVAIDPVEGNDGRTKSRSSRSTLTAIVSRFM